MKPILGITMGDAAGVGPEIIVQALADQEIYQYARPVVFGDLKIMQRAVEVVKSKLQCRAVMQPQDGGCDYGVIDIINFNNLPSDLAYGKVDARAGNAAYEYLERAALCALQQEIQAVVTAPLNKEALNLGGHHFAGHTEILAHLSDCSEYSMMLTSGPLKVIHVSTHVSLRKACELATRERVAKIIALAHKTVVMTGVKKPRIAVAGLNPHAGENGLFGQEEIAEIIPAIQEAQRAGLHVEGPVPPDSVFYRAAIKNEFDIVVVMYHDQGHIPIKLLGFETGVNVTVGLPIIRTSVDHGTAFAIAGQGIADSRSMSEALKLGMQLAQVKFDGHYKEDEQ